MHKRNTFTDVIACAEELVKVGSWMGGRDAANCAVACALVLPLLPLLHTAACSRSCG